MRSIIALTGTRRSQHERLVHDTLLFLFRSKETQSVAKFLQLIRHSGSNNRSKQTLDYPVIQ